MVERVESAPHLDTVEGPAALVITGPTATGKTELAIDVALALAGEIISMDSRQLYRHLDIGTAKPDAAQRALVPHHGLDILSPDQRYSAGRFARDARHWIEEISGRGHVPVLAGGTGFFLKALTHPLFQEPDLAGPKRMALSDWLARKPESELRRWLNALDPELAARLEREGGRQRVTRGLEVALLSGHSLSWWHHAEPAPPPLRLLIFVLEVRREELYRRINERVVAMIHAGLVDEVRTLVQQGFNERSPGMKTTGYLELLPYLRGEGDLASAIDAIQRATRRYARRQHTWFRHQLPPHYILPAGEAHEVLVRQIVTVWRNEVESAHRN